MDVVFGVGQREGVFQQKKQKQDDWEARPLLLEPHLTGSLPRLAQYLCAHVVVFAAIGNNWRLWSAQIQLWPLNS